MTAPSSAWPALKVIAFFAANPDEHMSARDMALKFDVPRQNMQCVVSRMSRQGWLEVHSRVGQGGEILWRAGPVLLQTIGAGGARG
ncbi:MAG TPA: helix-turn-helix domain-containing protein [Methylibium sp.]|nr:helix-turn-helix domain-containing protein [Methylibium sp.]